MLPFLLIYCFVSYLIRGNETEKPTEDFELIGTIFLYRPRNLSSGVWIVYIYEKNL